MKDIISDKEKDLLFIRLDRNRNGKVEILPNELGDKTTPSIVSFTEEERLVGEETQNQLVKNPKNTISAIKRLNMSANNIRI